MGLPDAASGHVQIPDTMKTTRYTLTRRLRSALLVLAIILVAPADLFAQTIGASLQNALNGASILDRLEVVVSFEGEGPLNAGQIATLQGAGVTGFYFKNLPIAGVLATPSQIQQLAGDSSVRSLWLNERLEWENDGSTAITGVDRLRTDPDFRNAMGLPYSGKGISVLVNDSGVDGTHPDLENNVVQNVAGQTNLNAVSGLLPVTYVEDLPNTDHGGGHGTHVAGIVAGTGAASGGKFEGVAPGAGIVGYGSGAVIFILDTIGGFDYALTHQFQYNIRVVSNSFGSSSDSGTDFQPDHPTNIATKRLADRGIMVVFSAGNSGPGFASITGNYKKAPWVTLVAAGDTDGNLADFSSRGRIDQGGTYVDSRDGQTYTWVDRPTVTAPGVDVVSANASTGSMHDGMHDEFQPYYTVASGTSMSCPHVSGIIALMLEADPTLDWKDVKEILENTATNMPQKAGWESGAGYVNAYAAVQETLARRTGNGAGFGETVNIFRDFNASASVSAAGSEPFSIFNNPVGEPEYHDFEVGEGIGIVAANANVGDNTIALVLYSPTGKRYGSSISLPVLGQTIGVSAPGEAGTWRLTTRGIGSVSGNAVDPLGLTNGYSAPGTISGTISLLQSNFQGLDDIEGHEAEEMIKFAVARFLVDGDNQRRFRPNDRLNRGELAEYLVMGTGVRQWQNLDGSNPPGVNSRYAPFAEAATARGAAMRDTEGILDGVMQLNGSSFDWRSKVNRASLAYSLVQSLGLQGVAEAIGDGPVSVDYMGERIELSDWQDIPADLRGHVQLALDLQMMQAHYSLTQGTYDLQPTVHAAFRPSNHVTRAAYVWHVTRFADSYLGGFSLPGDQESAAKTSFAAQGFNAAPQGDDLETTSPDELTLDQNYPNPFNPSTSINFTLPESGQVRLAVYDLTGRRVQVLMDGNLAAGTHSARFDATQLASGRYLYRLETPTTSVTKSMLLIK